MKTAVFALIAIYVLCFVLHIGFGVASEPLVAVCGLAMLAFIVYYVVLIIISARK